MYRVDLINNLIKKHNYTRYLEIGVRGGETLQAINCLNKDGVDPAGNCNYVMKSDDFFNSYKKIYDIIFVDGLHTGDQVIKDVNNSLLSLSDDGIIILHDCNPSEEAHQTESPTVPIWNGTVWKAIIHFRYNPDLFVAVINDDYGLGLIKKGKQNPLSYQKDINWENLVKNRKEWLNLISEEEYLKYDV